MTRTTISHYRIIEKLGEGGMGVVYKAEDTLLRRTVALKFLSRHAVSSGSLRARFLREAHAAGSLDHPNICTVYGIEERDGELFMVMAFIPGETLRQRVTRSFLPVASALDIAIQIGEGLQAAHEAGIVHRDVKSANIMLTPGGKAVIMDFGLALVAERSRLTRQGTIVGTVVYMSPEQALGRDVDRRTDIWSLGVVLYELITGRFPFQGKTAQAICSSIITGTPQPVTEIRKKAPQDLAWIQGKALAKRPEERYQHIADLLVDLRAARRKSPSEEPEQLTGAQTHATRPLAPTVTLDNERTTGLVSSGKQWVRDWWRTVSRRGRG